MPISNYKTIYSVNFQLDLNLFYYFKVLAEEQSTFILHFQD